MSGRRRFLEGLGRDRKQVPNIFPYSYVHAGAASSSGRALCSAFRQVAHLDHISLLVWREKIEKCAIRAASRGTRARLFTLPNPRTQHTRAMI